MYLNIRPPTMKPSFFDFFGEFFGLKSELRKTVKGRSLTLK
jgi:hypothetical protein